MKLSKQLNFYFCFEEYKQTQSFNQERFRISISLKYYLYTRKRWQIMEKTKRYKRYKGITFVLRQEWFKQQYKQFCH